MRVRKRLAFYGPNLASSLQRLPPGKIGPSEKCRGAKILRRLAKWIVVTSARHPGICPDEILEIYRRASGEISVPPPPRSTVA